MGYIRVGKLSGCAKYTVWLFFSDFLGAFFLSFLGFCFTACKCLNWTHNVHNTENCPKYIIYSAFVVYMKVFLDKYLMSCCRVDMCSHIHVSRISSILTLQFFICLITDAFSCCKMCFSGCSSIFVDFMDNIFDYVRLHIISSVLLRQFRYLCYCYCFSDEMCNLVSFRSLTDPLTNHHIRGSSLPSLCTLFHSFLWS